MTVLALFRLTLVCNRPHRRCDEKMTVQFTTATFDCYGTLIDWEGGIGCFLYDLALRNGDTVQENGRELRERWEALQFELIRGPYQRYEAILAESLRIWCEERGYSWNDQWGRDLARSMRSWQPFHDTKPALTQVREAGIKLVIISNTDRAIIEHSLKHLEVAFDDVITAEDCGVYKPSPMVFEKALAQIGEAPEQVLHVAFGFKYDIGPAQALGMKGAWVNRNAEPLPGPNVPDYEWRDLWGLAEIVEL
jgi:2-haloacid dehalogenase